MTLNATRIIISYFRTHWFGDWVDTWPDYKRNNCPMKTNMLLESYFKKNMIIHYRGRYTKSLHSNLEKIGASMRVDAGEVLGRRRQTSYKITVATRKRKNYETRRIII